MAPVDTGSLQMLDGLQLTVTYSLQSGGADLNGLAASGTEVILQVVGGPEYIDYRGSDAGPIFGWTLQQLLNAPKLSLTSGPLQLLRGTDANAMIYGLTFAVQEVISPGFSTSSSVLIEADQTVLVNEPLIGSSAQNSKLLRLTERAKSRRIRDNAVRFSSAGYMFQFIYSSGKGFTTYAPFGPA